MTVYEIATTKSAKERISNYYSNLKRLKITSERIEGVKKGLDRISYCMEGSNITFNISDSSMDYNKDRVQGGSTIYNGIEKEIDIAFCKLEKTKKILGEELAVLEIDKVNLEIDITQVESLLNSLDDESKKIIDLR